MKKRIFLRASILIMILLLVIVGGNAKALSQLYFYYPIVVGERTPTPTLHPPPDNPNLEIIDIFYDGVKDPSEPDEYVEIRNNDTFYSFCLISMRLSDEDGHVYSFGKYWIKAGEVCRIYTNEFHPEWCGFSYGSGSAIWDNDGDTATLRSFTGNLIDEYSY